METELIQDLNDNNKRPGKKNHKYHAQTSTSQKEGSLEKDIQETENIDKVKNSNNKETNKPKHKWTNDENSMQSKIKENTGKMVKTCFDDILVDCRGILFGRL